MKINGVEIEEFDIYKADNADKYEKAIKKVKDDTNNLQGLSNADALRKECEVIFTFFDELYGPGMHKKIFGEEVHLLKCLKAFEEFCLYINNQNETIQSIFNKYSPNRAQRRIKK